MTTTVVHCRREKYDVYIGRPGKWGNPFSIAPSARRTEFERLARASVILQYEAWLKEQPALLAALKELRGKTLGCWCSPKACHGEVLARMADAL